MHIQRILIKPSIPSKGYRCRKEWRKGFKLLKEIGSDYEFLLNKALKGERRAKILLQKI